MKPFKEANHAPVFKTENVLNINAKAGQKVNLKAEATDPDGDKLTYKWWQYVEVGTYKASVTLENVDSANASFKMPDDIKKGETIHIILEVSDNREMNLTRYQRVIITAN